MKIRMRVWRYLAHLVWSPLARCCPASYCLGFDVVDLRKQGATRRELAYILREPAGFDFEFSIVGKMGGEISRPGGRPTS